MAGTTTDPADGPPRQNMMLDSPARLKAISHPLRLGILQLLEERELTNEELAKALGVPSGKLYFHTKKLVDVGMIELAGTRPKGPLLEKLYRSAINGFTAPEEDRSVAWFSQPLQMALNLYRNTWKEIGDPHGVAAVHYITHHTAATEAALIDRLFEVYHDFQNLAVPATTPGARQVSFLFLVHGLSPRPPVAPGENHDPEDTT